LVFDNLGADRFASATSFVAPSDSMRVRDTGTKLYPSCRDIHDELGMLAGQLDRGLVIREVRGKEVLVHDVDMGRPDPMRTELSAAGARTPWRRTSPCPDDRRRQWPGVPLQGARCLGPNARRTAPVHPAWKAGGQRIHRGVQQPSPGRVPEPALVPEPERRPTDPGTLEDQLQHRPTSSSPGPAHSRAVRGEVQSVTHHPTVSLNPDQNRGYPPALRPHRSEQDLPCSPCMARIPALPSLPISTGPLAFLFLARAVSATPGSGAGRPVGASVAAALSAGAAYLLLYDDRRLCGGSECERSSPR